jgi:DNA primase
VRLSLASVLDYYSVRYRPGRREQKLRCLVHDDNDPSMNVNLLDGVWMCHSCGASGTALDLVMVMEGLDASAAREFAKAAGIEMVESDSTSEPEFGYAPGRRVATTRKARGAGPAYVSPWRR